MSDAEAYLAHLRDNVASDDATRQTVSRLIDHYNLRLWHEFGTGLLGLLTTLPAFRRESLALHDTVALRVRMELSPDVYCKLVYFAAHSAPESIPVPTLLEMLDGASASLSSVGAPQLVKAVHCLRALLQMRHGPDLAARRTLSDVKSYLDSVPAQDVSVTLQALYFRALVHLNELLNDHDAFYSNVFSLVRYSSSAGIPLFDDELAVLAYKTSIAGLLAKDVFNFGQLVNFAPFGAAAAKSPDTDWVWQLIRVCHSGDVKAFEAFLTAHTAAVRSVGDLATAIETGRLGRKVRLMALINLVYFTPPSARTFPLQVLADKCVVPLEEIEALVLSAFALGLVQGKIDGLVGTVDCTWVQPRVLSLDEIRALAKNIGDWRKSVKETYAYFGEISKDIPK